MTIWINGQWRSREEATVSVFDHGLLYGDGVFEGIRAYAGRVFRLDAHLRRLEQSCQVLALQPTLSFKQIGALVAEAVDREYAVNHNGDCYIRLLITRGEGPLGLDPTTCPTPGCILIADKIQLYPPAYYESGIPVVSAILRRSPADTLDPRVKSLNYLTNVLARLQARQQGAQEALMLNHQGRVTECSGDNIVLVRGKTLVSPPSSEGLLEGITLSAIAELARGLGYPVVREPCTLFDVYNAGEVFLTGTGAELVPVASVDGRAIRTIAGPVFSHLREAFHQRVRSDSGFCKGGLEAVG